MIDQTFLNSLLGYMGIEEFEISEKEKDGEVLLHIQVPEEDSGMLIGRRGETIRALQTIVRIVQRSQADAEAEPIAVSLDVNQYRERRNASIEEMAMDAVEQVRESGNPVTLPQMSPDERRNVHILLREIDDVETQSMGEGKGRRLTVFPKGYLESHSITEQSYESEGMLDHNEDVQDLDNSEMSDSTKEE